MEKVRAKEVLAFVLAGTYLLIRTNTWLRRSFLTATIMSWQASDNLLLATLVAVTIATAAGTTVFFRNYRIRVEY